VAARSVVPGAGLREPLERGLHGLGAAALLRRYRISEHARRDRSHRSHRGRVPEKPPARMPSHGPLRSYDPAHSRFRIARSAAQRTRGFSASLRRIGSADAAAGLPIAPSAEAQARSTWTCSSGTEHAAISAGTAGAASLPSAASALADMSRTFGSGSRNAFSRAGSAGSDAAPRSRRAIA